MLTQITDHLHAMQMQESPPNLLITSSLLHFIFNAEEDIFFAWISAGPLESLNIG